MDNQEINQFFETAGLSDVVHQENRGPCELWIFWAGPFQMLIQTQEDANRMRIVAFIGEATELERDHLWSLLEANYTSALDARYAVTEDHLVAAFMHPLQELSLEQFVLGLYQVVHCAETCGSENSGGTFVYGANESEGDSEEPMFEDFVEALVDKLRTPADDVN